MPEHTPAPTPSRGVYGFVMFLSFKIFFIIYLIWAVVPEKYFDLIGFEYFPQRYWAIAVPIYLLTVLTVFAFFIYPSLGLIMTPNVDDITTITDAVGSKRRTNGLKVSRNDGNTNIGQCVCRNEGKCSKMFYETMEEHNSKKIIPLLQDLDICDVSERLYLAK